ncbi:MAG: hypothetical protein JW731_13275 [Bacteroidales bacterium]|nr:hypothetical protein [Bacteroidales bacterium]
MLLLLGILGLYYISTIALNVIATKRKQKSCKAGEPCFVYIGESKFSGLIMKVSDEIDVWVTNKIIRFRRDQIYA